jgi:hypothetical protein
MQTKLTLRLDSALIEQAKQYAQERGFSLSQLVAEYFTLLTAESEHQSAFEDELPPITRSLVGILKDSTYDPEDYKRYLEKKYS